LGDLADSEAITTGRLEDRMAVMKEWSWIGDDPAERRSDI